MEWSNRLCRSPKQEWSAGRWRMKMKNELIQHWIIPIANSDKAQKLNYKHKLKTLNIQHSTFHIQNAQRAPKGQLLHSPGHRPGYKEVTNNTPCKGSSKHPFRFYSCPYRAHGVIWPFTQGDALGYGGHWAFSPYWLCIMLTTQN